MGIGSHTSPIKGATDTWLTPPDLIRELGPFDTDPCVPDNMPWETAKRMISEKEDGLATPWEGRVFMNPPYSKNMAFVQKFARHGNGIALVFARTETEWFSQFYDADAFLFIKGRLFFHDHEGKKARGNSGGPSVLVAYGHRNVEALRKYSWKHGGLFLDKH